MQPIVPPIKPGESDPRVANLQDGLRFLLDRGVIRALEPPSAPTADELAKLATGLTKERTQSVFGKATKSLGTYFQLQEGLGDGLGGAVEEKTAARLNEVLKRLGAFDAAADWVVRGVVADAEGRPFRGVRVFAVDVDLRRDEPLGDNVTDLRGRYEIRYRADKFARAEKLSADLRVRVVRNDEVAAESGILFNAPPEAVVDVVLARGELDPSEFEILLQSILPVLEGQGLEGSALPVWELEPADFDFIARDTEVDRQRIEAVATAFKLERVPESSEIPAGAFYGWFRKGLPVEPEQLWAIAVADLIATLKRALQERIVPSDLRPQLDAIGERIDRIKRDRELQAPGPGTSAKLGDLLATMPEALSSQQERALAAAAPALRADDRRLADKIADLPGFEGGANAAAAAARTLWLGALSGGHLPLISELQDSGSIGSGTGETPAFDLRPFTRLQAADWRAVLERHRPDGTPIGAPAGTPGRDEDERLDNYAASLVRYVEDTLPTGVIASRIASDDDINSPFRSAKLDLTRFFDDNPDFELGVAPVAVYLQEGREEKLASVADPGALEKHLDDLGRVFKVTRRFPQMRALIENGLHSASGMVHLGKRRFTEKYAERLGGFEHAEEVFSNAERVHAGALNLYMKYGEGVNAPTPFVMSTAALRRLPDRLVVGGVESHNTAFHTSGPAEAIKANWTRLFGPLDLCQCEHCTSLYGPAAYFVDILRFLDGVKGRKTPLQVLLARRPDLEFLELTCDNSKTPLPYVDLANELLEAAIVPRSFTLVLDTGVVAALDDLANEKLPSAFPALFDKAGYPLGAKASVRVDRRAGVTVEGKWTILDGPWVFSLDFDKRVFTVRAWPQTSWSASELGANAEHVPDPAYELLRGAVYPWDLPFNLPIEEARTYLRHLGVPRHEVMEIFFPGTREEALSDPVLAREYLGLTAEGAGIITGAITRDARPVVNNVTDRPWDFWGLEQSGNDLADPSDPTAPRVTGTWIEVLRHISVLLHQSGLSYRELLELLGTYFVNPPTDEAGARSLSIVAVAKDEEGEPVDPATCQLSKLRLDGLEADVENALTRTHRFVRLWRKLGWTARELDQAITAFDPENQTDGFGGFLVRLAHVARLRAAFDLPVVELLSWWSDIDTAAYIDHMADGEPKVASLYERLFRNKAVISPLDDDLSGQISYHIPAIVAALGIGAADLARLTTGADAVLAGDTLDLKSLSQLYRSVSLAKALELPVREYRAMAKLSGLDPFVGSATVLPTAATLRFVDTVAAVRESGFSFDELAYLLRHDLQSSSDLAPTEDALAQTLEGLRSELQRIAADTEPPTTDPNGDLTRKSLALLNWDAAQVDAVISVLNGAQTYEVTTIAFTNPPVLPNDTGSYSANLASLPPGLTVPRELEGVVSIEPEFLFACDGAMPVATQAGGVISTALRQEFLDNQINVAATATVTTDDPGTAWTIAGRFSVILNGGVLGIYDRDALTLRASRLLGRAEQSLLAGLSNDANFTQAVADLLRLQDEVHGPIAYEEVTVGGLRQGRLRFVGVMTDARKRRLETVSTNSDYRDAIQELYDAPRDRLARDARTFAVHDFTVDLATLPAIVFPAALKRKLYFDATSNPSRLHFVGVMTIAERETLIALSSDVPYQVAVKDLFEQAQPGSQAEIAPAANDVFLSGGDRTLLFDASSDTDSRFLLVLGRLLPYLRTSLSEGMLAERLADTLQLEIGIVKELLTRWITAPARPQESAMATFLAPDFAESNPNAPLTVAAFPDPFATLVRLDKVALVIRKLRPTQRQLRWLSDQGAGGGWLDLNALPVAPVAAAASSAPLFVGWKRLGDLFRLRAALPFGEMGLFQLFDVARHAATAGTNAARDAAKTAWFAELSRLTSWSVEDIEELLRDRTDHQDPGILGLAFPAAYTDERIIGRLRECFKRMKRLGASAAEVVGWADRTASADEERAAAISIKNAAKSKHSADQWLAVAKPLKAPLRERQRSALVSYLVAHPDAKRGQRWTDVDELYEHLLVDVQMDACMTTTRLLQATNSMQLFIQRCLMSLEPEVPLTPEDVREWTTWRKQYRLWEANRKVLFYPENWIEPELRDDKSPFFEELESELTENELTMDTAEDAIQHYLEKVDQVARLEIVGMYREQELADPVRKLDAIDVLHVFGRTAATPHQYFYRRLNRGVWSAWERVPLDIEGDHLIPVIWNRRLQLFWAVLTEKQDQPTKEQRAAGDESMRYWEIKLAWSQYRNKGWSPKRISAERLRKDQLLFPQAPESMLNIPQEPRDISFKSRVSAGQLVIGCYGGKIVYVPVTETVITPAPALQELTAPAFALVSHDIFGALQPTFLTCRFTVNGAAPTRAERDRIAIQLRELRDGSLRSPKIPLNSNGAARSPGAILSQSFMLEVVSTGFRVSSATESGSWTPNPFDPAPSVAQVVETFQDAIADAIADGSLVTTTADVLIGASIAIVTSAILTAGASLAAALASIPAVAATALTAAVTGALARAWGRRVLIDLAPLPAPQPTTQTVVSNQPVFKWMQGFGEFTLDDASGALRARTVPSNEMIPAQLSPLSGTRIDGMMFLELGSSIDHALRVGRDPRNAWIELLQATPGTFRVLASAQDPEILNESSFFFQDRRRVYLVTLDDQYGYRFTIHFHPRIGEFVKALKREGVPGLLRLPSVPATDYGSTFMSVYRPTPIYVPFVSPTSVPNEDVDFSYRGAYSLYNWELFFHVPFLIAIQLSKNQRFDEAQRWFHYIFDPTATDYPGAERFWRVQPFHDQALRPIQTLEALLKDGSNIGEQVDAWQENPFKPHVIARLRVVAYMKAVVMRYLDNLMAWGDRLFRQDTIETINEATQLYVLAAQILGKRPEEIPPRARPKRQTFRTLDDEGELSSLSNAIVEIEGFIPPSAPPVPANGTQGGALVMPFFCLTPNETLLGYWDTVADRLFKIRHCMNIEGVERTLPLFQPPIDPALLVRAAAAGVDIASVLADLTAPRPHYRFNVMLQKATELCADVKALGGALLAALEKKDAEELALLRSRHEVELLESMRETRKKQVDEANHTLEGLRRYQDIVTARQDYYRKRPFMISEEEVHLDLMQSSLIPMGMQAGLEVTAAILNLIPESKAGAPTTAGITYGGSNIAGALQAAASAAGSAASIINTIGSMNATRGGYRRRQDDWTHQAELATKELLQIEKQIAAAEVRVAIAEKELVSHELQVENAKEVDAYLRDGKFTNKNLYGFMVGKLSGVYFQGYQLAYDVAKRAERTFRYELGLEDSSYVQFGYWDSLKKGLLCGERLHHDLKRMDVAYLDQNGREYEITKHVSLQMLDPIALLRLKETGNCFVTLPEALFDLDYPGHYMRRFKSVSISIPCVTGPYAGVNCTLTQLQSSIRHANTLAAGKYARKGDDDRRFSDSFGLIQSIVTSGGQNDSGLFEPNLRDERYLPYEGQGTISSWRIQLPTQFKTFDYDTISDVVLHLRYTAREGGELLKQQATTELAAAVERFAKSDGAQGLGRAFSLRHEFPAEWHRFLNPAVAGTGGAGGNDQTLTLALRRELFPYQFQDRIEDIAGIELYVKVKPAFVESHNDGTLQLALAPGKDASSEALALETLAGLLHGVRSQAGPFGDWTLTGWLDGDPHMRIDPQAIQDVLLVCRYGLS